MGLTRLVCQAVFPAQNLIADVTGRRFSDWARCDRWLETQPGRRVSSPTDPEYRKYLALEQAYWKNPPHGDENTVHGSEEHPKRHARLRAYWNQLMTGDPQKNHVQRLRELGPFKHALALAHCPGLETMMASGLADRWTYNSITGRFSDLPIQADRLTVISEDLNFASLEEGAYDLILAEGVLHHIINIDHLLAEVSRALAPNGVFFVMEYVGEERFGWRPEKRRFLNGLLAGIPLRFIRYKMAGVDVIHLSRLSPFEAVTSARLPDLLQEHFAVREVRTAYGVLFPTLEFLKEEYLCQDNPALDVLLRADMESARYNLLPTTLAGVFAKPQTA